MTAEFLWINIPLMAVAFALWVGVPMWMILRHPDQSPRQNRTVPVYLRSAALSGQHPARDSEADRQRELASAA